MNMNEAVADYCAAATANYEVVNYPHRAHQANYKVYPDGGIKYIKLIVTSYGQRSVFGFIVNVPEGVDKFAYGDILKAASWKAPAKNFARGNVFKPESYANIIRWTGAA